VDALCSCAPATPLFVCSCPIFFGCRPALLGRCPPPSAAPTSSFVSFTRSSTPPAFWVATALYWVPTAPNTIPVTHDPLGITPMAFRLEGSHMDDEVATSLYIRHPIADEDLKLYADPSHAAIDGVHGGGNGGGHLEWLEGFCRDLFEGVSDNVSRLNQLVGEGNTGVRPRAIPRCSQPSQRAQRSSPLTRKTEAGPSRDRRPLPATSPTSPPASRSPTAPGSTATSATKATPVVAKQSCPNACRRWTRCSRRGLLA